MTEDNTGESWKPWSEEEVREAQLSWIMEDIGSLKDYINLGFDNDPDAFKDDYFIAHAILLFSIEQGLYKMEPNTAVQKAAFAICERLSYCPDIKTADNEGRVSFPFLDIFADERTPLSRNEIKQQNNAKAVIRLIESGMKATIAMARVAERIHTSPQKVHKDYYRWRSIFADAPEETEWEKYAVEKLEEFYKNYDENL